MSEEVSAPAPAAPAPVAVAPVAVAPTSAPAPAETSSYSGQTTTEAPAFAWSSWDGTSDVPEDHKEAYSRLSQHFEEGYQEREDELTSLRSMYSAMLSEEEDPRIQEATGKYEALQKEHDDRGSKFEALQKEYNGFMESSAGEYVDRFWKDHEDLAKDSGKLQTLIDLIDEENVYGGQWDGYIAAELLGLPEGAQAIAFEAKKDGVSDIYALKLAKAHAQLEEVQSQPSPKEVKAAQVKARAVEKAKRPRQGAKITNGATTSSSPRVAKGGMGDAHSLDDLRNLAARRALRVHGGGR